MEEAAPNSGLSLRKIFGLSSIYGITPILDRAMGLLLLPLYTHYLDTSQYGSMVLFYTFAFIVRLAAFMGFPDSLQKLVWDYQGQDLKKFLGTVWLFNLGANLAMLSALGVFSRPISGFLLKNEGLSFLLVLVVVNVFLATQSIIPYVLFRAREKKKQILAYNMTSVLVRVGATVLFLVVMKMGLVGIFLADIAASLAVLTFTLPMVFRSIEINFHLRYIRTIFRLSFYQLIIELFAWITSLSDRVLIHKIINSTTEVGIYAVGYTFGSAVLFLTKPIQAAWVPYIYSLHSKDKNEYKLQMSKFFTYYCLSCVLSLCLLLILSPNIIVLLTPKAYHVSKNILILILLGHFFAMMANYFTASFYLMNNLRYISAVYFITALINIALNVFLIPKLGIYAAALSTFICYLTMALFIYYKSQKIKKIEIASNIILKATLVILSVSFLIYNINVFNNMITLIIKSLMIIIMLYAMYLSRRKIIERMVK